MRPYIHGRKNLIHIIDVRETIRGLLRARKYLKQVASTGSLILFVGTKRQAREIVAEEARRCSMPYVDARWLGGMLTNFKTVKASIKRLKDLEQMQEEGTFDRMSKREALTLRGRLSKTG